MAKAKYSTLLIIPGINAGAKMHDIVFVFTQSLNGWVMEVPHSPVRALALF